MLARHLRHLRDDRQRSVWSFNVIEAEPNARAAGGASGLDAAHVAANFRSSRNERAIWRRQWIERSRHETLAHLGISCVQIFLQRDEKSRTRGNFRRRFARLARRLSDG